MFNKNTRLILAASTLGLLSSGVDSKAAGVFSGITGDGTSWEDAGNWDDGIVPVSGAANTFNIFQNRTADFDADAWAAVTKSSVPATLGQYTGITRFFMGESTAGGNNGSHVMNFNPGAGAIMNVTASQSGGISTRPGKNGTLNVQSGSLLMGSSTFSIGNVATGAAANGAINVSGGELSFYRAPVTLGNSTAGAVGTGAITVSGGAFTTRTSLTLNSTGSFNVVGSNATQIGIGAAGTDGNGAWSQASGATLSMMIDTSVTKIFIEDGSIAGVGSAVFSAGSILDLGFVGAFANGDYTLMEFENGDIDNGVSNDNLLLNSADALAGWSYRIDNTGANGLLIATFVPEPSTALLSFSALGMLLLRRRR